MDAEAFATALACIYGPDRAAIAPSTFTVHAFTGHEDVGGVEISDETEVDDGLGGTELVPNGYAPATADSDDFVVDDIGMTVPFQFPDALEEWQDATHVRLKDPVTGFWWNTLLMSEPLDVGAAGPIPESSATVFFAESVEPVE